MTDDHIKRFSLSEKQPHRDFHPSAEDRPRPREKDNTHYTMPPPKLYFIPDPQLAPPGMMGVRPRFSMKPEPEPRLEPKPKLEGQFGMDDLRLKRGDRKPFVPLVPRSKEREWER